MLKEIRRFLHWLDCLLSCFFCKNWSKCLCLDCQHLTNCVTHKCCAKHVDYPTICRASHSKNYIKEWRIR